MESRRDVFLRVNIGVFVESANLAEMVFHVKQG